MSMTARDVEASAGTGAGRGFVVGGLICSLAALVLLPILFGPAGAVLGFVGYAKGDRRGLWVGIAGIVATVAGLAIAAMVFNSQR